MICYSIVRILGHNVHHLSITLGKYLLATKLNGTLILYSFYDGTRHKHKVFSLNLVANKCLYRAQGLPSFYTGNSCPYPKGIRFVLMAVKIQPENRHSKFL